MSAMRAWCLTGLENDACLRSCVGETQLGKCETHREYLAASIRHELNRCGSTVIRSDSSERMFHEFVRMVSTALAQSTRNQLRAPSVLSLGDKA